MKQNTTLVRKLIIELNWIFGYHFAGFLYNSHNIDEYYQYMQTKWGSKYIRPTE